MIHAGAKKTCVHLSYALQNKYFGWAALLCCCASFAHSTASEPLGKHTLTSTVFSIFALFQLYTAQFTELRVEK